MSRVVGNGTYTWSDVWYSGIPFKVKFPRLFALSTSKDVFISELWCSNAWSFSWCRPIRGGVEIQQLDGLLSRMCVCKPLTTNGFG